MRSNGGRRRLTVPCKSCVVDGPEMRDLSYPSRIARPSFSALEATRRSCSEIGRPQVRKCAGRDLRRVLGA